MRIAVIGSKGLPPHQGGIEHHCAEIYPRMVAMGHSVDLYARSSYNQARFERDFPEGRLRQRSANSPADIRGLRNSYQGVNVITVPSIKVRGVDALACSAMSAAIALRKPYDIVHFHALGPSLFTPVTKAFSDAKVLTTCHGLDWQRAKWGAFSSRVIKTGERSAVRFADRVVVVSEALQAYFLRTYGIEAAYIENAPVTYAPSDRRFAYGRSLGLASKQYMVFLGRLVPEKRVDLLIKAFQRLGSTGWKLVLVGDTSDTGTYTAELMQLAAGNPNIVFTGELQAARLSEVVRGAGLLVLPSEVEGLPLALLEAMHEGVPTVASDIPVHAQILGRDRGLLFESGSLQSLESRLDWAIANSPQMRAMARRAGQYVRSHHNWDNITQKYVDLYGSLLGARPRRLYPVQVGSKLP